MSLLSFTALVMMALASNIIWILIGRLLIGICAGAIMIAVPIFLSEISSDHNRGKIGCFLGLFFPLGQLFSYIIGPFFSVRSFTLICTLPLIFHLVLFLIFVSESPIYLVQKEDRKEAVKSLMKYKRYLNSQEIEKEVQMMECALKKSKEGHNVGIRSLIKDQQTRRGFLISVGMFTVQLGSGIGIIFQFMGPIFQEAHTGLSGDMTAIIVGVFKVIIYFIVTQIVEKIGRKPLIFSSCVLCSISLFFLGLYFYMKEIMTSYYKDFFWLPLASIFLYILGFSLGLGPIPPATVGELFNTDVRSIAVSTAVFLSRIFGGVLLTFYPLVVDFIGNSSSMWIFSIICALGAIIFYFEMPETKGKSFIEIQELLRSKSRNIHDDKPL